MKNSDGILDKHSEIIEANEEKMSKIVKEIGVDRSLMIRMLMS